PGDERAAGIGGLDDLAGLQVAERVEGHVRRATALCRDADVEKYAPTVVADVADIVTKTGAAVVENFLPASDGAASHVDSAAGAIAPRVIDVEASAAAVFQGEV